MAVDAATSWAVAAATAYLNTPLRSPLDAHSQDILQYLGSGYEVGFLEFAIY